MALELELQPQVEVDVISGCGEGFVEDLPVRIEGGRDRRAVAVDHPVRRLIEAGLEARDLGIRSRICL